MNKTENIIQELTDKHAKVTRDFSPVAKTFLYLYSLLFLTAFIMYLKTPFYLKVFELQYQLELISMLIFIHALCFLGFTTLVPGEKKSKALRFLGASFLLIIFIFSYRVFSNPEINQMRTYCDIEAMALSLFVIIVGHFITRKNIFLDQQIISKVLFVGLSMIATLLMHMACKTSFVHAFTCHFVPPLFVTTMYLAFRSKFKKT